MSIRLLYISFLFIFLSCSTANDPFKLTGKIVGSDGKPLPASTIRIRGNGFNERIFPDSTGEFEFNLSVKGGYYISASAVYHNTIMLPVIVDEPGELKIIIHLGNKKYESEFERLKVIGEFNDFSNEKDYYVLNKDSTGNYTVEIETEADTFGYKIYGVLKEDVSIAGTHADYFVNDKNTNFVMGAPGNFISVIKTASNTAKIIFSPSLLPQEESSPLIDVLSDDKKNEEIFRIDQKFHQVRQNYTDQMIKYQRTGGNPRSFRYDWSDDLLYFKNQYTNEEEPAVKDLILLTYFQMPGARGDTILAREFYEVVSPASFAWSLIWGGPNTILRNLSITANQPAVHEKYIDRMVEEHSDSLVRAATLFHYLETVNKNGETEKADKLYDELQDGYSGSRYALIAKKNYAKDKIISVGNNIPEFSFTSLDDSSLTISNESLLGKYYLIDFWATWCGPCIAEMENLHKTYEKYKDKNFTILSISVDRSFDALLKFRKEGKWAMPWLNVYIESDMHQKIAEDFELITVPKPILVDDKGKIIATQEVLRGPKLDETLQKFVVGED
ncbi:redoxin domain-containing protein [Bacteroidota bacterium]